MTTNEGTLRTLTGVLAVLIIATLGHPFHAASQGSDLVTQGRQALDAGRVDEAIALFARAVAADAKSPSALAWLGSARVRKAPSDPTMVTCSSAHSQIGSGVPQYLVRDSAQSTLLRSHSP